MDRTSSDRTSSKVPSVTAAFWEILAAAVGETGGDALSMTLHLGTSATRSARSTSSGHPATRCLSAFPAHLLVERALAI